MKYIIIQIFTVSFLLSTLSSCFKDDETEPLKLFPGKVGNTEKSIYTHQSYYCLEENRELAINTNSDWDIGFEGDVNGEHVILNSADVLYISNLGPVDFATTNSIPDDAVWSYDASSGNYDSLAINGWVNTNTEPYEYSHNVYIISQKSGITYSPFKKFKLIELTNNYYKMVVDVLENSTPDTIFIQKNNHINFVAVSMRNKTKVVPIEPNNSLWDIQFTQYASIIPDDNGVPTPYLLRGVYINTNKIKVTKYYISTDEVPVYSDKKTEDDELQAYFEDYYKITPLHDSLYKSNWDVIGYKWKTVTIDKNANTAVYKANLRHVYLIKDIINDKDYKLQFFSFKNEEGFKGYPWFEFIEIE